MRGSMRQRSEGSSAGRLGHRNPNVTLNVYAHFLLPADRKAAEVLGGLLNGSATSPA